MATRFPTFQYQQLNPSYQSDPARMLGAQLQKSGVSSEPVRTPLAGLGRLSNALVGAYLQKGAMDRQVAREDAYKDSLTKALSGMNLPENSPIKALFNVRPELGLASAVDLSSKLAVSKANVTPKFVNVYKDGETKNVIEGSPTFLDLTQNKGYTTDKPASPGSIGSSANLVNEYLKLDNKINKSETDLKQLKLWKGILNKDQIMTIPDGQGGTITKKIPGLNIDKILNNTSETKENNQQEIIAEQPLKLSTIESKFVGNAVSAKKELSKLTDILFSGNLQSGEVNRSAVAGLNLPGGQLVSEDAQILANIIFNLSDLRLRDKSGATAPPEEVKRYFDSIVPKMTDKDSVVRLKIERLINELTSNVNAFNEGRDIKSLKNFTLTNQNNKEDGGKVNW